MRQTESSSGAASFEQRKLTYGLLLVILALKIALATQHTPWMDELQALQIARAINSLSDVYWALRYEGHPPLWHLIIKAALLFRDTPETLAAVALAFSLATTCLIMIKAPFPLVWRVLLCLSYLVMFEYGFIARSYSVVAFLMLLIAAYPRSRLLWLPLVALTWIATLSAVMAVLFTAVLAWLRMQRPVTLCVIVVSTAITFAFTRPPPDFFTLALWNPDIDLAGRGLHAGLMLSKLVFTENVFKVPVDWEGLNFRIELNAASILFINVAIVWTFRKALPCLIALYALAGLIVAIDLSSYALSIRHFGMIWLLFITLVWATWSPAEMRNAWVTLWLVLQAFFGLAFAVHAFVTPFAATRELDSAFSRDEALAARVTAIPGEYGVVLSASSGRPFYSLESGCFSSYRIWRSVGDARSKAEYFVRLRDFTAESGGTVQVIIRDGFGIDPLPPDLKLETIARFNNVISPRLTLFRASTDRRLPSKPDTACTTR
jgi:hypothetical protein